MESSRFVMVSSTYPEELGEKDSKQKDDNINDTIGLTESNTNGSNVVYMELVTSTATGRGGETEPIKAAPPTPPECMEKRRWYSIYV